MKVERAIDLHPLVERIVHRITKCWSPGSWQDDARHQGCYGLLKWCWELQL